MQFFNFLMGMLVLTSPLWFLVLMVPVAIGIAVVVAKRVRRPGARLPVGLGVFVLVYVLPWSDEIAGRIYLNYLCTTQAGVRVYQTVELPAEYWDEEGNRRFRVFEGDNHKTMFLLGTLTHEDIHFEYRIFVEPYKSIFSIEQMSFRLRERKSGRVLGEVVSFMYWGGWMRRNVSLNNSAKSCEMSILDGWIYEIFKPSKAK